MRTQVVTVPPLRGRPEDIADITRTLIRRHAPGRLRPGVAPGALRVLIRHSWPGNVRELEALLLRLLVDGRTCDITPMDLAELDPGTSRNRSLGNLEALERDAIVAALRDADGNRTRAALALGMSRSTLYRKIGQYGIDLERRVF